MRRYGDSGRDSTARKQYEAHKEDGFKFDENANHDVINRWTKDMDDTPIVDTSKRIDNTLVSDVTTELIKLAVSKIRKIHPPDVKLCEVCEVNAVMAVIRLTLSSYNKPKKDMTNNL